MRAHRATNLGGVWELAECPPYTGLLKAFLDPYPANGLKGVTAIPVYTGAT